MVQAIVDLGKKENQILTIVKGKYGLKNRSEAVNFVIDQFEKELLEPALKPTFVKKMLHLEKKGTFTKYKNITDLRKESEDA